MEELGFYLLMANPLVTATVLPFIIGFWAAFYGVFLIIDSFSKTGNGLMKILSGILMIIIGIISFSLKKIISSSPGGVVD